MADFSKAYAFTLDEEGGYSNRSNDKGGPTRWGITLKTLTAWRQKKDPSAVVTIEDVQTLDQYEATEIAKTEYWDYFELDKCEDQVLALIIFDQSYNRGQGAVARDIQYILGIKVDGVYGPHSKDLFSTINVNTMKVGLVEQCQRAYAHIATLDPGELANLGGWIKRSQKYYRMIVGLV